MIARRLIIHGRVQGVWFRSWAARTARELGLAGWVRNRRDGTVEALVEGEAEAVETFIEQCREGPTKAVVEHIEQREDEWTGMKGFAKQPTV